MKKFFAFLMVAALVLSMAGCGEDVNAKSAGTMTFAQYDAANLDSEVTIEGYLQAKQKFNAEYGNTSLYIQDGEGAYFVYRIACDQAKYDSWKVGSKVKVTGFKAEWSGEVEIADASSIEVLKGEKIFDAKDVTSLLGSADLVKDQNKKVVFKGMTVEASKNSDGQDVAFLYNWDGSGEEGSDLYFNVSVNGKTYNFCVETDLCGKDTDVYKAVKNLKIGDKVDVEGFLYWYNGANPHVTSVKVK
ncbi:MAG: hypothetical protein MJ113_04195 [Lachnospiraceae bacterium]|nr:hypothetical protein [Lachnospiraceae bacterium]